MTQASDDKQFVREAAEKWAKTLEYANAKEDAMKGSVAIALWATFHVDRLIEIARKANPQPPKPSEVRDDG